MKPDLCFTSNDFERLRQALLPSDVEHCAVLFAAESRRSDGQVRLLVREIEFPEQKFYSSQSVVDAQLSPEFVARVAKKALIRQQTVVFVHTHPGTTPPHFSSVDDLGEGVLRNFLLRRGLDRHHAALVLSEGGIRARRLGTDEEMRVIALGEKYKVLFDPGQHALSYSPTFDRQVRAFGEAGQKRIEQPIQFCHENSLPEPRCASYGTRCKFARLPCADLPEFLQETIANAAIDEKSWM